MLRFRFVVSLSLVLIVLFYVPAKAATLVVTNLNDSGSGSLRDALASAAASDTITFAPGLAGSIPLASPLTISQTITIQGPGAVTLALDGQTNVRVIDVSAGTLTLSGLTIANGKSAALGGAINIAT